MIAEHGKAHHIQCEDARQFFQPAANSFFAMRVILAGSHIFPTEVRASDAAINQMKRLDLVRRTYFRSIHPWHHNHPQTRNR